MGAVQMHGAGPAQRLAATEFGPGHPQRIAQRPKDRGAGVGVDRVLTAVHVERDHGWSVLRRLAAVAAPLPASKEIAHPAKPD